MNLPKTTHIHNVGQYYVCLKVKQQAEEFSSGSDDMSSDDTDFNPDALEALSAKEEYDSEPSTTSSEEESGDDYGSGPEAERKREEKQKLKAEKKAKREKKAAEPKSEKKVKKKKMTKLPGQPKKNMSAYFIWMNKSREQINKDYPDLSLPDFSKKAGELWKAMDDKSAWQAKAEEDKKRYDKEFEKWKSEGGAEAMKAAMKQAKKEKRQSAEGGSKAKSKLPKKATESKPKESLAGTGGGFKSKEYITEEDSSD